MAERIYLPYRPSTGERLGPRTNVGKGDRIISGLLGAMALAGATRAKGPAGKAAAIAGGALLLKKAATGRSNVYQRLGVSSATLAEGAGIDIRSSITVNRPRSEVYGFWSDLTNLPLVMSHIRSVEPRDEGVTHWQMRGPRGMRVSWDAQMINMRPNEFLAWESMPDSRIEHAGSVHFSDAGDKGTEVLVRLRYVPPGMAPGFALARVLNPITEAEVAEDLRRFKHMMETGVDITVEGQPMGARKGA